MTWLEKSSAAMTTSGQVCMRILRSAAERSSIRGRSSPVCCPVVTNGSSPGIGKSGFHTSYFVVLTKYDVWKPLFPMPGDEPFVTTGQQTGLDRPLMLERSAALRKILVQTCPEVVMAAEDFSSQVIYWPASPLGRAPVIDPATRAVCLAPGPIKPVGVTAPLLFGLNLAMKNLVLVKRKPAPAANTPTPEPPRPSKTPMPKTPGSSSGRLRPGVSEDTQS